MLTAPASGARARLKAKARRLRPRRFQAYCIGAAKTGTTSVAGMFAEAARAGHEPEPRLTTALVIDHLEGRIDEDTLAGRLRERDRRLRLELESAHPLGYVAGTLVRTFPEARFVVTVREPRSWLESRLNFHHAVHPPAWERYREYFWTSRHQGHAPEEAVLADYGLCSIDVYLAQYADHYRRVLSEVPEDRRLVVTTADIDRRGAEIAAFLGVDAGRVVASHEKQAADKINPLDRMDRGYVDARILHHCRPVIEEFFPRTLAGYESPDLGPAGA